MKDTQKYKIRKNYEFKTVYRRGKSYANRQLVLYVRKSNRNINRMGISCSKKVGNAVVRNRVKRLIKENYHKHSSNIKKGYEFVIVARSISSDADYQLINSSVVSLFKKAGLYLNE